MNFEQSDERAMLRGTVQRFVADRHGNTQRRAWRALPYGFSPKNRAMLAEIGIPDLPIAAGQSGLGALADIAVVMEDASLDLAYCCVQLDRGMGIADELDIAEGHRRILALRRLLADDGPCPLTSFANPLEKADRHDPCDTRRRSAR